jgi:hypothetical protein
MKTKNIMRITIVSTIICSLFFSCTGHSNSGGNKGDMPVNNNWKNDNARNGGTTGYINPITDSTRDNQRFHDFGKK